MADRKPWLEIRRMRSAPPVTVAPARIPLFQAALEQAEAFHRAAIVGDTVSPVLFSYCLKQFGLASLIASGSERLPSNHGMSRVGKTGEIADPLDSKIVFKTGAESGFACIAGALGDVVVADSATTRALLAGNPDTFDLFPAIEEGRPIRLAPDAGDEPRGTIHIEDESRPLHPGNNGLRVEVMYVGPKRGTDDFEQMLSAYDIVPGWRVWSPLGGIDYSRTTGTHNGRVIEWNCRSNDDVPRHHAHVIGDQHMTPGYSARSCLAPKLLAPRSPTGARWSRFTWWSAGMFALDTAARYHPDIWASLIDLDETGEAADIRGFLELAADAIPEAGLWAVRQAAHLGTQSGAGGPR